MLGFSGFEAVSKDANSFPRYTPAIKRGAAAFAILVCIGFIAVPVAVLAGVLTLQ